VTVATIASAAVGCLFSWRSADPHSEYGLSLPGNPDACDPAAPMTVSEISALFLIMET
jgi:hypothetical protein